MSLGEDRIRPRFNPSDSPLVDEIKDKAIELINLLQKSRKEGDTAEIARLWSLAQTSIEDGCMWGCKAASIAP
jgi:hypothetical protein